MFLMNSYEWSHKDLNDELELKVDECVRKTFILN